MCGLDKPQAESWRERPLAIWLETRDAAVPKVLTSVPKISILLLLLEFNKSVWPHLPSIQSYPWSIVGQK